jgi:uncharacterized protein
MKSKMPRTVRFSLAGLLIAFGAGCAYLETKQSELIFRPAQGEWRGYNRATAQFEDRWIPVGDAGERVHAWWSPATDANAPVLLYLHGARWNLSGSSSRIPRWNKMGFSVLAIDYRGFGESTARTPTEASAYEDAEAAWEYLAKIAPDRKRYIFGHSLGGAVATHLALKKPEASGVILEATFTSVPEMVKETKWGFLPVGFLVTQRFESIKRINEIKMPILFAHGTLDEIVPFNMGERLFAAAKAPKRFVRVEGGNHHNLTSNHFEAYSQAVHEHFGLQYALNSVVPGANAVSTGGGRGAAMGATK